MLKHLSVLTFAACLNIPITWAAEPVPEFSSDDPSCACVAQGKRWAQGEEACISGIRMVCSMSLNMTTWKSSGQSCQVSSLFRAEGKFTPM